MAFFQNMVNVDRLVAMHRYEMYHMDGTSEFREDDTKYMVFGGRVHVRNAAFAHSMAFATFGVCVAIAGLYYFPFELYETAFDVVAILGFAVFMFICCWVHGMTMYAIYNIRVRIIMPAILFHCFMMAIEIITALIAVGDLVADQESTATGGELMARNAALASPLMVFVHSWMVYLLVWSRIYLRNLRRHIRNGQPPPVAEVVRDGNSLRNKIFNPASTATVTPSPSGAEPNQGNNNQGANQNQGNQASAQEDKVDSVA